ncbi:MAG: P-loop NTPase [Syntrophales bacterium]
MISVHDINETDLNTIRIACAFLFSPELARNNEFLKNIDPASVKKAYRDKAKRYHPDLHIYESNEMIHRRKEHFIKIQESYELLNSIFREKTPLLFDQGIGRGNIIAIAGAKGGIGKSMFATNMGVLLASMGKKTVLVDLDLGGANLHLYLGETRVKGTIDGFLNRTYSTLQDITVKSKHGPLLISGDSSQLGVANINFAQKVRLLKAIKQIEADYVILDLGGDTTYNIIDFFLAADYGIVITTCDPASYLEAYNFLKVALYRKLNRIFGAESAYGGKKNAVLEDIIHQFTFNIPVSRGSKIQDLLTFVKEKQPGNVSMIWGIISTYRPYLVVNRVTDQCNVQDVVERIKVVSKKVLSINVECVGRIPYQQEIEISARELVPVVARYPQGILAKETRRIVNNILS